MNLFPFFVVLLVGLADGAKEKRLTNSKLVCYYGKAEDAVSWKCSHVVLPQDSDIEAAREKLNGVKILLTVDRINEKLISQLKNAKVDGLDVNLKKLDSKHDISDFVSTIRTKLGSDLYIALSVPPKSEILAKHYDFKSLSKHVDLFILQTAFLGPSKNVTFHPSRLSGLWDMQNTDSVVDLVTGLGAPHSKLVVAAPVQAFQFLLQDKKHTAPGSPALEVRSITRDELCSIMSNGGNWTLERDQDQAGPYIFSEKHWIAFDDPTSVDIKAKYARVRGLAGLALKDLSQDGGSKCGGSLLDAAYNGLSRQSRAPRAAVLHSLEREILETPVRPLDTVQVSPYRISRVIDVEGNVHVIRQDTRTEFECSRQGYYVHPRSCGRFYRCVKFDQLSDDFNVFEFDCPAGLAFDSKYEVCVWPGSLSYSSPCSGSSEIAPVPRQRFICPGEPGYYADPENCRWFFACLDHGKSPLSAYEFRCPFGLVFDEERLVCEWPWLVPRCASAGVVLTQTQEFVYGSGYKSLEQYDGLGHLGVVRLGGLSGGFIQAPAKVYTSAGQAIYDSNGYQNAKSNIEGIDAARLGVSAGIAKAQEDARIINEGLGGIASVRPAIGNINIVGAGYSAVGVAASASNADIQISHDGSSRFDSVTALPNAFTTVASVPFVSSVPFPTLNASELEGFNGGVVANLPQLQYKVKSPSNIFFDTNVGSNLSNETLFVNYVSSTPSPFVKAGERYEYANTAIPFLPNSGAKITVVSSTPATSYVESSEGIIAQPVVPIFRQEVSGGPIISNFNYQQSSGQFKEAGVSYSGAISTVRPDTAIVHQQPAVQYSYQNIGATAKSSGASGYQYQQQQVVHNVPVVAEKLQPVAQVDTGVKTVEVTGYKYPQPQQEVVPVVEQKIKFVTPAPIVQYSYHNVGAAAKAAAGASGYQQQQVVSEVPVVEQKVQFVTPAPVVQYSYQNVGASAKAAGESGYQYNGQQQVVTEIPVVEQKLQFVTPAPVVQYSYQGTSAKAGGESGYQKQFVTEVPVVEQKVQFVTPAPVVHVSYQNAGAAAKANSYQYQQDYRGRVDGKINFASGGSYEYKNPAYVETYNVVAPQPAVVATSAKANGNAGAQYFNYSFVSTPAPIVEPAIVSTYIPSTVRPLVTVQQHQPASVTSYSYQNVDHSRQGEGYAYTKPAVRFEETPVTYSTPTPAVVAEVQPVVTTYSTPAPPVVQQKITVGYSYPKPEAAVTYSTPAPAVVAEVQPVVTYSTPAPVVQQKVAYSYPKPNVVFEERPAAVVVEGYNYPKPAVAFEEKPVKQSVGYSYPKPAVVFEEKPAVGYTYEKPVIVFEEKPIVVEHKGYSYPKPAVVFEETPAVVVSTTPAQLPAKKVVYEETPVKKPAVVTSYQYQRPVFKGYDYPKPAVTFSEGPYQNREPVQEEPFVRKTAYVTGNNNYQYQKQQNLGGSFEYVAPTVETYVAPVVSSAPAKPKKYSQSVDTSYAYYNTYSTANAAANAAAYQQQAYYANPQLVAQPEVYVSSTPQPVAYVSSTPQTNIYVSSTPKPTFTSVISKAAKLDDNVEFYSYDGTVSSTPRPVVQTYSTPATVVTQSPPISRYVFSSLDEQYQTTARPVVTVATSAPVTRAQTYVVPEAPKVVVSTPPAAVKVKFVESYVAPELQTPSTAYLPVAEVTTPRPVKVLKVRPKVTMIVKENDFHPLLSAKLGAQCTCVSNTLKLKKPPPVIVSTTTTESNNQDDEYYVRPSPDAVATDDSDSIEIENYRYEPARVLQSTPAPEITIKSTTNPVQPAPAPVYAVRKRVRVRPATTVAYEEASTSRPVDVFLGASEKSTADYTDKELADSVRKGLNLIKTAAKEGAREALDSPAFDRYGPGGWRSRDEKLQGVIDCQRAGLFRHPTECNKFYACRWDCDKKRFTLHVFNCPVHLTFDSSLGACNWPSQGPACLQNTLLPSE